MLKQALLCQLILEAPLGATILREQGRVRARVLWEPVEASLLTRDLSMVS